MYIDQEAGNILVYDMCSLSCEVVIEARLQEDTLKSVFHWFGFLIQLYLIVKCI